MEIESDSCWLKCEGDKADHRQSSAKLVCICVGGGIAWE